MLLSTQNKVSSFIYFSIQACIGTSIRFSINVMQIKNLVLSFIGSVLYI